MSADNITAVHCRGTIAGQFVACDLYSFKPGGGEVKVNADNGNGMSVGFTVTPDMAEEIARGLLEVAAAARGNLAQEAPNVVTDEPSDPGDEDLDDYGNPLDGSEIINCCFPDCGCDGARLCQAKSGASSAARSLNIERGSLAAKAKATGAAA